MSEELDGQLSLFDKPVLSIEEQIAEIFEDVEIEGPLQSWLDVETDYSEAEDHRTVITDECTCGNTWFKLLVAFDEGEVALYMTDMECLACGTRWHAPIGESRD